MNTPLVMGPWPPPPHGLELGKIPRLLLWGMAFSLPNTLPTLVTLGRPSSFVISAGSPTHPVRCQSLSPRVVPAQQQRLSLHSPTSQTWATTNQGLTLTHLLVTACGINLLVLLQEHPLCAAPLLTGADIPYPL